MINRKVTSPSEAAKHVEDAVRGALAQFEDDDMRREVLTAIERRIREIREEETP